MKRFVRKYPFFGKLLIAALIVALVIGLAFLTWGIVYWAGGTHIAPTFKVFTNAEEVFSQPAPTEAPTKQEPAEETEATTIEVEDEAFELKPEDEEPSATPTPATPTPEIVYVYVTPEPTAAPTEEPTAAPTEEPTAAPTSTPVPAAHATYTQGGNKVKVTLFDENGKVVKKNGKKVKEETDIIRFQVDGKWVYLKTFEYHGGYIAADDPTFSDKKVDEKGYGPTTYGKTVQEVVYNDLRDDCRSGLRIIHLQEQIGMIKELSLEEETRRGHELEAKPADEYDKVVNETLVAVFKYLYGGRVETEKNFDLINIITVDENRHNELHGQMLSTKLEEDEYIYTLYPAGGKSTFVSSERGFKNTATDAKAKGKYSQRAYRFPKWGGNWVWRKKGGGSSTTTTTTTTTDNPETTSTPPPSRPTKNPDDRPQVSDAPVGGGGTNPENSEDQQTSSAPVSTPAPEVTAAPVVTAAPTAVPTAVVRPTENCEQPVAPLIHEDTTDQPSSDPAHNVPTQEPSTAGGSNNNGDFNPDDI